MPAAPVSGQEMIEGQLNAEERRILTEAIRNAPQPPRTLVEVGTWLGGGSTLHILRAMQANGVGHLWGIEAHREMYERMIANLRAAAPDALDRFTPLFGFSEKVIPRWLAELPTGQREAIDLRVVGGLPYTEVAGALGCTDVTARKRVSQGLRSLRTTMGDRT